MSHGFSRRRLLATIAALPLAACAGQTTVPQVVSTIAADAKLIVDALAAAVPQLSGLLRGGALATVKNYIVKAQSIVDSLAIAPVSDSKSLVQQLVGTVNAVLGALNTVQLPGKVNGILADVQLLLPVIEIAVGFVSGVPLAASPVDVESARLRLRSVAFGG
jgi:hypothetical protein